MSEYREAPDDVAEPVADSRTPMAEFRTDVRASPRRRTLIGPFTVRRIALANGVVVGAALVLFVVTRPIGGSGQPVAADPGADFYRISAATQGLAIGQRAPELAGENDGDAVGLTGLDGKPITLASLKGHPVWINFWATWCPPCQRETPVLRDAYEAHRTDGLVLIAIDVQEDAETVRQYATTYGLTYPIGLDTNAAVFRTYRIFGLPSQYFIDRNDVIRGRYFGPLNADQVEQQLDVILTP